MNNGPGERGVMPQVGGHIPDWYHVPGRVVISQIGGPCPMYRALPQEGWGRGYAPYKVSCPMWDGLYHR